MRKIKKMNNIKYFDIHSHLNFPDYDKDREEVIRRMYSKGIATITVGTSYETSKSAVALAKLHEQLFASIGIHPMDSTSSPQDASPFDESLFEELVKNKKVVAIGECGMDFGRSGLIEEDQKRKQRELFEQQIDFGAMHKKPIMIHARNSNKDILDILSSKKKEFGDKLKGNAHFFTGSIEEAKRYFDLDFSVSFTGVITFARDYDEVIRFAPLSHIMVETDAPFVSPIPFRGKRNEPSYVPMVVKALSEIKGLNEELVRAQVLENAVAKFNLV